MSVLTLTLSPDRLRVIMAKRLWRQEIALADLPAWITLYRELHARQNGRFARFYARDLAALMAFDKEYRHVRFSDTGAERYS